MLDAREVLRRTFGFPDFRPAQVDVVEAVLAGHDTVAVLPTGGGKSLCYQVPALVRPGLTVVISPLISLMKDQVDRLEARGVSATLLNSTLPSEEVSARLARVARRDVKLLYVAPERFESFDLKRSLAAAGVTLLAVDEAHCISEWGHDFRPSFRRIAEVAAALGRPQIVALTATATPAVRDDIVRQLRLRRPRVIVRGFDRANLHYGVHRCRRESQKHDLLLDVLAAHHRPAIVYAATRSSVERVARQLTRARVPALPYHAGLDDLQRHEMQERFMTGRAAVIVATNAFGMGIDKPDVRLVAHFTMPGTLEAYYQEAGRAGRDGQPAHCVLLHAAGDRATHEYFIRGMHPERQAVERTYRQLRVDSAEGRILKLPSATDGKAALRVLEQHGVVCRRRPQSGNIRVRLLATAARIRHELGGGARSEVNLLRCLWRLYGERLYDGCDVEPGRFPPAFRGRGARDALTRLRDAQFVDFATPADALYLARPSSSLESFGIDWQSLARRRTSDLGKLDAMQQYVDTRQCRRAFVLRYFGERVTSGDCARCDNCGRDQ